MTLVALVTLRQGAGMAERLASRRRLGRRGATERPSRAGKGVGSRGREGRQPERALVTNWWQIPHAGPPKGSKGLSWLGEMASRR